MGRIVNIVVDDIRGYIGELNGVKGSEEKKGLITDDSTLTCWNNCKSMVEQSDKYIRKGLEQTEERFIETLEVVISSLVTTDEEIKLGYRH